MLIKPVSLPRDRQLLKASVACIRQSTVYLLTARRNAWNGKMLNRYLTSEPAYSNAVSASSAAELRRKPGTYFEISEEISLVFDLAEHSLVVMHLNAPQRFSKWKAPAAIREGNAPITGLDAFAMFAGSRYRGVASGWESSYGAPDVIVGIAETSTLATTNARQPIALRRSSIKSDGSMEFHIVQKHDDDAVNSERIVSELAHRTLQKYPVHEIYLWCGEYFCTECARSIYTRELQRVFDHGWPVRLTEPPPSSTFCSVCLLWFNGTNSEHVK